MTGPVYETPYTPYPGGSTPAAGVGPEEGRSEMWKFFGMVFLNTSIIAVVGVVTWVLVH